MILNLMIIPANAIRKQIVIAVNGSTIAAIQIVLQVPPARRDPLVQEVLPVHREFPVQEVRLVRKGLRA